MNTRQGGKNILSNAEIYIAGLDSIRIDAKIFGLPVVKFFSDRNSFKTYNAMENSAYTGNPSSENIKKTTGINLGFEELVRLVKSLPPGKIANFKTDSVNDANSVLSKRSNSSAEYIVISSKTGTLEQYQRKNSNEGLEMNVYFRDYKRYGDFMLPGKIYFKFPLIDSELDLEVKNYELNPVFNEKFNFKIPSSANLKELE